MSFISKFIRKIHYLSLYSGKYVVVCEIKNVLDKFSVSFISLNYNYMHLNNFFL